MNTRGLGQASAAGKQPLSLHLESLNPISNVPLANNWFWNFIISRFTPQMFNTMGPSGCGVFFFFASMMLCSIVFVWFFVPETKSIPLEDMDRLFEIKPVRKANKIIVAQDRERDAEFRHDAEGAGLSVSKEKMEHVERTTERDSDV